MDNMSWIRRSPPAVKRHPDARVSHDGKPNAECQPDIAARLTGPSRQQIPLLHVCPEQDQSSTDVHVAREHDGESETTDQSDGLRQEAQQTRLLPTHENTAARALRVDHGITGKRLNDLDQKQDQSRDTREEEHELVTCRTPRTKSVSPRHEAEQPKHNGESLRLRGCGDRIRTRLPPGYRARATVHQGVRELLRPVMQNLQPRPGRRPRRHVAAHRRQDALAGDLSLAARIFVARVAPQGEP
mmetsp:Transcript_69455/g.201611  ORF Transcript_69455/g.201611 Transcript_69455/m.201611 type:complete len:243 (+) Transcript_69455:788-1516(+)